MPKSGKNVVKSDLVNKEKETYGGVRVLIKK